MKFLLQTRSFLLLGSASFLLLVGCTAQRFTQFSSQRAPINNLENFPNTNSTSVASKYATVEVKLSQPDRVADPNSRGRLWEAQADTEEAVEFRFFARRELPQDPRVVEVMRHPCGLAAVARVTAMPDVDSTGYLVPDRVVEIAPPSRDLRSLAGSTTLHRWAKPIDSTVLAIEGDRILVNVGEGRSYWIEPSGNFQLESNSIDAPEPDSYPHQTALGKHPDFVNSSYANIWEFPDLNSGQTRVLIYEANCT